MPTLRALSEDMSEKNLEDLPVFLEDLPALATPSFLKQTPVPPHQALFFFCQVLFYLLFSLQHLLITCLQCLCKHIWKTIVKPFQLWRLLQSSKKISQTDFSKAKTRIFIMANCIWNVTTLVSNTKIITKLLTLKILNAYFLQQASWKTTFLNASTNTKLRHKITELPLCLRNNSRFSWNKVQKKPINLLAMSKIRWKATPITKKKKSKTMLPIWSIFRQSEWNLMLIVLYWQTSLVSLFMMGFGPRKMIWLMRWSNHRYSETSYFLQLTELKLKLISRTKIT